MSGRSTCKAYLSSIWASGGEGAYLQKKKPIPNPLERVRNGAMKASPMMCGGWTNVCNGERFQVC